MLINLRLAAAALTSLALASACGSTALKSGAPAPDASALGGGGLSVPSAAPGSGDTDPGNLASDLPSSAPAADAGPGAASQPASSRYTPPPGSVTRTNTGTHTVTIPTHVPVVTVAPKAPIRLGIIGVDTTAIAGQFGKKATDPFAGIKPMLNYLNAHGGIAGHQIKPVYTRVDSGADTQTSGQKACAALTQDNTIDLAMSLGFGSETLNSCLLQKGISLFSGGSWVPDRQWAAQYPNLFQPVAMSSDRDAAAALTSAINTGALKSGDKLGVLVENCPWGNRIYDQVIAPLAQKHGISLEKASVTCITNLVNDLGPVTQDLSRDALLLASKGVTHVYSVSVAEGFFNAIFSQVASTQKFLPKYIITSTGNPYVSTDPKGVVHFSPDALKNIIGVGFRPALDVGPTAKPTSAQAAQQALCKKMDPTWGGAASVTDDGRYFGLDGFYGLCDTFNAIAFVLANNGNKFGLGDMAAGYQALLNKGVSAAGAGGAYGGGAFRHDGLGFVQPLKYDSTIGHIVYSGPAFKVS
jgi:hypothetical protein